MQEAPEQPERLLRLSEVRHRVGLSRATLWRWERVGKFPKRRRIGPNTVGWLKSEVDAFVDRIKEESTE
jgi:prophage regulatory protein